jgi:hypothetical protein
MLKARSRHNVHRNAFGTVDIEMVLFLPISGLAFIGGTERA